MKSSFQDIILTLQNFWAEHGCLITQPYYTQVGAGTMNPATFLRVLGPEPWNVAYVEPSVRPDDGRYGENPNRFQVHYQFQVILKPDPGNPQELYLESLKAVGIDPRKHDIRFVEDNWEQPAISAWGLGWEVWLDGQEITQFTYFQQVGGVALDPVAVEITYGLERILIALNNADAIWDETWGADVKYGEVRKQEEFQHSKYYFEVADVTRIRKMYDLYKAEAEACLAAGLVLPAHDYVLKCSHAFNTLDTRGAIGATERQAFFGQMRDLARRVALAWLEQRKELGYPLLKERAVEAAMQPALPTPLSNPAPFVFEIGTEELPATELRRASEFLELQAKWLFQTYDLPNKGMRVYSTPRRLVVYIEELAPQQTGGIGKSKKGPAEKLAFDDQGNPTRAALGWAKSNGIPADDVAFLRSLVRDFPDGRYLQIKEDKPGLPTTQVLTEFLLFRLISEIKFDKTMRWLGKGSDQERKIAFSRPIRWLVALYGETVIPFEFAGVTASNVTRGLRPYDSPEIQIKSASEYLDVIREAGILLDPKERRATIVEQINKTAGFVGGDAGAIEDSPLLDEVTNLVEKPTAVLGNFNSQFLELPRDVLISTMKKHQRYFPLTNSQSANLLPNFIAIRNGDDQHLDLVQQGNEHVLRARFADANFFVRDDLKQPLEAYRPKLAGLVFHAKLGSMLDKSGRMLKISKDISIMLGLTETEAKNAQRATFLAKADLVTKMVTEMTSLQGVIGREYALRSNEDAAVAEAIGEQYQSVPKTRIGMALALSDRLDSLVGLFAAGLAPTGTKDPFGLRRAAVGVVQPLMEHDIDFDLGAAVKKAAKAQPIPVEKEVQTQVLDFLAGRLNVLLKDSGYKYDVVDAVLAVQAGNPAGARRSVKQLQTWVERDDWKSILPAFARCVRITRDQKRTFKVDEKAFVEKEEKGLYADLKKAEKAISGQQLAISDQLTSATRVAEAADAHLMLARLVSVDDLLNAFVPMIPAINAFFDKILVMADEKTVRENRLGLLQRISVLVQSMVDLSKLEGF